MTVYVFDTGALVALQRERQTLLTIIDIAHEDGVRLRTTAPALTEFLGRSPRQLRGAGLHTISLFEIGTADEPLARRAALLQQGALDAGGRSSPSSIDALVAADAETVGGTLIYDGDRGGFEALAEASGRIELEALDELSRA